MGVHAPGPAEAARTAVRRSPTLGVRTAGDPVADDEAALLGHLTCDHGAELDSLAAPEPVPARARRVLPVAPARYGPVLRATGPGGDTDLRLPFREPLSCPRELSHRTGELLAGARSAEEARTA